MRFRRQQVIGPFIVDFYCAQLRVAIELDGPIHAQDGQAVRDAQRDSWIAQRGIHLLRLPNDDVSAEHLRELLTAYLPPLPEGEGVRG